MNHATISILQAILAGENTGAGLGMIANKTKQLPNLLKRGLIDRAEDGKYAITDAGRLKLMNLKYRESQKKPTYETTWKNLDPSLLLPNAIHITRMEENKAIPSLVTAGVAYW